MKSIFLLCAIRPRRSVIVRRATGKNFTFRFRILLQASDGTPLTWTVYTPSGEGPWPAVLVIHGGLFIGGDPEDFGATGMRSRFSQRGFHRLRDRSPPRPSWVYPGSDLVGQFPEQYDDVHLAVQAARNDGRSNGQVGAVGGSSGGTHAAWAAATGTPGDDRLDVAVCLSGAYDFSDFSPDPDLEAFIAVVTNYVGVPSTDTAALRAASPAWVLDARSRRSFSWTRLTTQFPLRNSTTWSRNSMRAE